MTLTLVNGDETAARTLVFAHGAGAAMDTPWMTQVADGLAHAGIRVVRFEFPYMAERRVGKRRPPDRMPVLLSTFRTFYALERAAGRAVFVGGKSMGGRVASMVADEVGASGVVCMGYPFKPPGKDQIPRDRIAHLEHLRTPALIVQGDRDPFGGPNELAPLKLAAQVVWVPDGDHDLKPRVRSGHTFAANMSMAIASIAGFVLSTKGS